MECIFCNADIEKGTEKIYVTSRGGMLYFCSNKCEKNMLKLRRKARKVKWTREYRREKDAHLKVLAEKESGKKQKKKEAKEKEIENEKKKSSKEKAKEKEVEKKKSPKKKTIKKEGDKSKKKKKK